MKPQRKFLRLVPPWAVCLATLASAHTRNACPGLWNGLGVKGYYLGLLGRKERELQGYKQKFDNVGIYRDTNSVGMYKFRVKELLRETKLVFLSMHNLYESNKASASIIKSKS